MSSNSHLCSFCLGGDTDIPPFGNIHDAEDLIHPCSTCSLVAHRKCLLDWFNSLPSDKLHLVDSSSFHEPGTNRRQDQSHIQDFGVGQPPSETRIHINISTHSFNQWLTSMATGISSNRGENISTDTDQNLNNGTKSFVAFLLAQCPQCKNDIVFSMKRSPLLALNTATRTFITRSIHYGGLFLGFTSAVTGIVSMGYVGLTTCGLKMMDSLIPGPLLVEMLSKKTGTNTSSTYSSLSQILFGNVNNYSIDNLEQALLKGLIDPLKFSRIPILPIVLYRMRSSSFITCLFGKSKESSLNGWIAEFMINGYISSLGNHELGKGIIKNLQGLFKRIILNPSTITQGLGILDNINLWKINNLISMLIPLRWLYDLFFRLTLNRAHFNLAMTVRPRDIANSLSSSELDIIEELNSQIGKLELTYKTIKEITEANINSEFKSKPTIPLITSIFKFLKNKISLFQTCVSVKLPLAYSKLKILSYVHQTKACIKNDYSTTLLYKSLTIRAVTTILWPFLSSKLGHFIFNTGLKNFTKLEHIPSDKLLLLSNILGLVGVVFIKDLFNLYLSSKKASQLSQMAVLCVDTDVTTNNNNNSNSNDGNDNNDSFENDWETEDEDFLSLPGRYPG